MKRNGGGLLVVRGWVRWDGGLVAWGCLDLLLALVFCPDAPERAMTYWCGMANAECEWIFPDTRVSDHFQIW
ncbi:hypothetical protein QL285_056644 [Trifolium repens]|nr:hypothetical protein QL285_056644 [Trifolium repens]